MLWGPDIEGEAESILLEHGFPIDEPPDIELLARCVVGCANVVENPRMFAPARYVPAFDRIEVRPGVGRRARRWLLPHELAERHVYRSGYRGEDAERVADAIAGAIIAPRRAVQRAARGLGRNLSLLALALETTQSIASLRLGEVTGSALALITPSATHLRGENFAWPSERHVRALAAGPLPDGVYRVELTDAPRRVVLRAV